MNDFNSDYMRTEIAILQEEVPSFHPGVAKFKIPALMTSDTVATVSTNNNNIVNRRNSTLSSASVEMDDTIDLYIPAEHTYFLDIDVLPVGSKFIVSFVGGNPNDIHIIGYYHTTSDT